MSSRDTACCSAHKLILCTYSKRLLSLAAEKFVSDIATDAFQYARIRTNAGPGRQRAGAAGAKERARTVLTMDDLSAALGEYGINAKRAEFYR